MKTLFLTLLLFGCDRLTSWQSPKGGDLVVGAVDTSKLRGKTLFIFFGFLHCPHVCPTTISELNRMAKGLTSEERKKLSLVFISVDPDRDTPSHLRDYFSDMDRSFLPVSGAEAAVRAALGKFGGSFSILKGKTPDETFIDHTSTVFVVNEKGVWVNSLPYDSSAKEFRAALASAGTLPPYWKDETSEGPVTLLGVNQECDVGVRPCTITAKDGPRYDVFFDPVPVRHLKTTRLIVRAEKSDLVPVKANFIGVEQNMGLIRPHLMKASDGEWAGSFQLPACNLRSMHWNMRVLLQGKDSRMYELRFHLSSRNLH